MKALKRIKKIHFIGIGGSGMIGIAKLLIKKGFNVSGSDITKTIELRNLASLGAKVSYQHKKNNIKTNTDLVVVSSAIGKRNIEILESKKKGITIIPRAEMLSSIMRDYESIVIAGSHGKTTTTSMIAEIFNEAAKSPTYVVGGKVLSTNENSDLGTGDYLIAEADESDGSFLRLYPDIAVITNIDDDHLLFYKNSFEKLLNAFVLFSENIPFYGYLVVNIDDKNIRKILKKISRKIVTFGFSKDADYVLNQDKYKNGKAYFTITSKQHKNKKFKFTSKLPGIHNIYNAGASAVIAFEEKLDPKDIYTGIKNFDGVGRRYQKHLIKLKNKKFTLIDDYGHHPVEVDSNIKAIKEEFKDSNITMIFQPHRFSRTAQLFHEFIKVLKQVDTLIVLDVYAASEKPIKGINSKTLVESIKQEGHLSVHHIQTEAEVIAFIKDQADLEILVTQGAGNISNITSKIINL